MKIRFWFYLVGVSFSLFLGACGVYSFSGASIDYTKVKTVSIQRFYNQASQGPPTMSQEFTEALKDYFQQNTQLNLVQNNGDLQIDGTIVSYDFSPVAPTASGNPNFSDADAAGLQRLKITVKASYINTKDPTFDFEERSFSFYKDYDPNREPLTANEDQFVNEIFEQIVLDIFNASVANW